MNDRLDSRPSRRRRADGERSRAAILDAAARLATVEGLEGLSIARLAAHTGMSKSGLFAHFGSKEELQLATVETAEDIFRREVLEPGLAAASPLARVEALCESFLSHVERAVFPGGCFFASTAAELDTRPGRVRERVAAVQRDWLALLESLLAEAVAAGELPADTVAPQLAFEVNAMLSAANGLYLLQGGTEPFAQARQAIRERLGLSGAAGGGTPRRGA